MSSPAKPRIVIVGSGGHGHVMLDVLWRQGLGEVVGFLDDQEELLNTGTRGGVPVVGSSDWETLPPDIAEAFVIAIGNNGIRREKFNSGIRAGLQPWQAIHPSAIIAESAELGAGAQVVGGVIVNPYAHVGLNVILNTGCTVDHDCQIGDHAFIAPGVHLGGAVEVGGMAVIGLGAVTLPGLTIGEGAIVGAGAVVIRDVEPWTMVVGVPAQVKRRIEH
jgi:sugar O-acyltransferase (sialic acid O-acetyltransferase NeuD family)